MTKRQKTLFIIGVVILILVFGFYLYSILRKKPVLPAVEEVALSPEERAKLALTEEEKKKGITLEQKEAEFLAEKLAGLKIGKEVRPEIKVVTITKILDKKVKFSTLAADRKKILYFDPSDREFHQADLSGSNDAVITRGSFADIFDVTWSADRQSAILVTSKDDGKTREYYLFDFREQKSTKLDSRFQNAIPSPDGKKIAYVYVDKDRDIANLSLADDPSGKNFRILAPQRKQGKVFWPSANKIAFEAVSSAHVQGGLFVFDTRGKDSFVLTKGRYAFSAKFSPDGKMVIYTDGVRGARKVSLYSSEVAASKPENKLPAETLTEKCAWLFDSVSILCGVPENFSNFYLQPDDWYTEKFVSRDSFYKINSKSNELQKIAMADQFDKDYDVSDPVMSDDGKTMYFTRRHDGKLYALKMP